MPTKSAFCIARSREQAEQIIYLLKTARVSAHGILPLSPGTAPDAEMQNRAKAGEGTLTGVRAGGILGGALAWVAGLSAWAVPGAGQYITASPVATALGVAFLGGVAGGLMGWGIAALGAKRQGGTVEPSQMLISVHTEDAGELIRAREIFKQAADYLCVPEDPTPTAKKISSPRSLSLGGALQYHSPLPLGTPPAWITS